MRIIGVRFSGSVIAVRYTVEWRDVVGFSGLSGLLVSHGGEQSSPFLMSAGTA